MIEEGSGAAAGPLSVKTKLSRPLVLSLAGSPLRNVRMVDVLVAVKGVENCVQPWVVVQVVQLFVNAPRAVLLAKTFTVLVTPKPVDGLSRFPTQKDRVYESPMIVATVCCTPWVSLFVLNPVRSNQFDPSSATNERPAWTKSVLQTPTSVPAAPTTVHEVMLVDAGAKTRQVRAATAVVVVSKLLFNMGAAIASPNAASARKAVSEVVNLDIFCLS